MINAIINAKSPIASAKAKDSIDNENNWLRNDGFLETPVIKAANTKPAPIALPNTPIVAQPAPINLPACIIIKIYIVLKLLKAKCLYFFIS